MSKTTFGYQLKACGSNRHAAKYAGINDKLNIIYSMAIAGALSAAGASLYYLAGNTEFFWSTYQALPAEGFNGIPVALLASNNPIGVIFTGCFMSMLNIAGMQLKTLTAYNAVSYTHLDVYKRQTQAIRYEYGAAYIERSVTVLKLSLIHI